MAKVTTDTTNKEKIKEENSFKGFEEIALCFSGGGYRAACFSFGTLSFFDKIGLLNKVSCLVLKYGYRLKLIYADNLYTIFGVL